MNITQQLKNKFSESITSIGDAGGYPMVSIEQKILLPVAQFLKNDLAFNILMDLSCVDYLRWEDKANRFEMIYNLFSIKNNTRVILKVAVPEKNAEVESITELWPAADWYEREVWDMFGVRFTRHPNLKRILMYEGFKGHALRKDYPYYKRQPLIGPKN